MTPAWAVQFLGLYIDIPEANTARREEREGAHPEREVKHIYLLIL